MDPRILLPPHNGFLRGFREIVAHSRYAEVMAVGDMGIPIRDRWARSGQPKPHVTCAVIFSGYSEPERYD